MPSLHSLPAVDQYADNSDRIELDEQSPINDQLAQQYASNSHSPDEELVVNEQQQEEPTEPIEPKEDEEASVKSRLNNFIEGEAKEEESSNVPATPAITFSKELEQTIE